MDRIENPRLQRLRGKLMDYRFKAEWKKGKDHQIPDALSRAPVDNPLDEDHEAELDVKRVSRIAIRKCTESINEDGLYDPNLVKLTKLADEDTEYQSLIEAIKDGFPTSAKSNPLTQLLWNLRDRIWTEYGLAVYEDRIIVPQRARREVLEQLHSAHQGIDATKRRSRQSVYWPGINSDIQNRVEKCEPCQRRLPSQGPETIIRDPPPTRIFEDVACDLFDYAGKKYLAYVDRYSGWTEIKCWNADPTSSRVIAALKSFFTSSGIPNRIATDGGPQFDSREFKLFLQAWNIEQRLSSSHYAQSNGLAESAVKSLKALVAKTTSNGDITSDDFQKGLLELRNTPRHHGLSPAQIVFGHPTRTFLPASHKHYKRDWKEIAESLNEGKGKEMEDTNTRYNQNAKDLPELDIGTEVRVQNHATKRWDKVGVIIEKAPNRKYTLKMPSGRSTVRNRRQLRPVKSSREEMGTKTTKIRFNPEVQVKEIEPRPKRNARKPQRYRD